MGRPRSLEPVPSRSGGYKDRDGSAAEFMFSRVFSRGAAAVSLGGISIELCPVNAFARFAQKGTFLLPLLPEWFVGHPLGM